MRNDVHCLDTGRRRRALRGGGHNLKLYVDSNRSTSAAFRPDGIPMSILIDREGNVVGTLTGAAEWDSAAARELVGRYLEN